GVVVLQDERQLRGWRRLGQYGAGGQVMGDLGREPWPPVSAAADHDAVGTRLGKRARGVGERRDVAVATYGETHRFLYVADEGPIGMAVVELTARAAVHGDHLDAAGLGDARQLRGVAMRVVPAHTHLQCDRQGHRGDRRLQDPRRVDFVAHQRRTGVAIYD